MHNRVRFIFVSTCLLTLSSCANLSAGNLFSHYSAQNQLLHSAVEAGRYDEAEQALPDAVAGDILDNMEKGRVYLLSGQTEQSQASLKASDQAVRAQQAQATISLSETATSVGSLAVNDNLDTYQPADYEVGFLHLYLGLTYLEQNDLDGALVEMRYANQVQEQARKDRERELQAAQDKLEAEGLASNIGAILARYPDAGATLQAVQNGYLLYLSALLYEADNDLNSAYVDYRRALAVQPDNLQISNGAIRVAKRLGMSEDLQLLLKRYPEPEVVTSEQARVIILDEQGVVQAREGWQQSLPIYDRRGYGAIYSIALPYYPSQYQTVFPEITLNQQPLLGDTLVDVNQMAQRDLSEKMPAIIIRQALRVWAKEELRKSASSSDKQDVGNLIVNIWNTLTEQPDTRSWQTLPSVVSSRSAIVNSGQQVLKVAGQEYRFDVPAGQTALVWVSRQGNNAVIWHKQLGRL
ncbi:COG3014 family protein [Vibrio sp.]|uniref:COG3014 family protein n=1 Tax=Vibrio sp. TaxID=678 RepID=UPI003D0A395B